MTNPRSVSEETRPLPCPFGCGAKVERRFDGIAPHSDHGGFVVHGRWTTWCPLNNMTVPFDDWNRRAPSGDATDTERMNALEEWLGDGTEGTEDENVSLWRDFEVPEGCSPSFAVSGYWPGNTRGNSLREAIDAAVSEHRAARRHQEEPK